MFDVERKTGVIDQLHIDGYPPVESIAFTVGAVAVEADNSLFSELADTAGRWFEKGVSFLRDSVKVGTIS